MNRRKFFQLSGRIVDVRKKEIYEGTLSITDGIITEIVRQPVTEQQYLLPGFIDAHVHVESSMLVPSEFARLAAVHGTVATVSDPHEIGNVLGLKGVEYMIENGKKVPFKFYFGAPSCVPATPFETAGAVISCEDIEELFQRDEIKYLAEMMNWPGVLNHDPEVMRKIALAQKFDKQIDGHAPGLRGEQTKAYAEAGMTTDHECFTKEEALDKLQYGMKILIREGSAAKNFEALIDLLPQFPGRIMFCSDDKHPDNLVEGHINELVKRALAKGMDVLDVLQAACINPVDHYKLEVGTLQLNDPADLIVVENLESFKVLQTYINGYLVAENGKTNIERTENEIINNFNTSPKKPEQFRIPAENASKIRVIECYDGQLITGVLQEKPKVENGNLVSDTARDILKLTVVNRYEEAEPAVAFIRNFGLKRGAIASSVGHDSHNIIAVGVDDESICRAVNLIIEAKGGVAAVDKSLEMLLPLPVAGIMSAEDGYKVAEDYSTIDRLSKAMCGEETLTSPFMTLSFMALLVIPSLKLSDKGLFDGEKFEFVDVRI
ncbi:MAG: adenine deaminase [Hymenobacteraceae bacterium]|nr:adenine deaminase [Hymenobacteraceae bacterium]MDX5394759.1 adenine deaminase [Hymenobacteraceae bacterium]MDX5443087.1 adenine deaminase [Hymenobacteraceae bacterium]MDX5510790.1 adenine deaminase [Hymenobacteraceae bacterium]